MLEDISYTCGATFEDITMPEDVCIRFHRCFDPVEKLYYSSGFQEPICIYCSKTLLDVDVSTISNVYPRCTDCVDKPPIKKTIRGCNKK